MGSRAPLIGNPNGHFTKPGHFYPELLISLRIKSCVLRKVTFTKKLSKNPSSLGTADGRDPTIK